MIRRYTPRASAVAFCLMMIVSCAAPRPIPAEAAKQGFDRLAVDETKGPFHIAVYEASDTALQRCGRDCLRGKAWWLEVTNASSGEVLDSGGGWGEAGYENILDYSNLAIGEFRIVELTYDPRNKIAPDRTPFTAWTWIFSQQETVCTTWEVLLEPEAMSPADVRKMVDATIAVIKEKGFCEDAESVLYDTVAHLRNVGVRDPELALEQFHRLNMSTDAVAWNELISKFADDVETMQEHAKDTGGLVGIGGAPLGPIADRQKIAAMLAEAHGNLLDDEHLEYLNWLLDVHDVLGSTKPAPSSPGDVREPLNMYQVVEDNRRIITDEILATGNGPMFKWIVLLDWDGEGGEFISDWVPKFVAKYPDVFFSDEVYDPECESVASNPCLGFESPKAAREHIEIIRAYIRTATGTRRQRAESWVKTLDEALRDEAW